MKTLVKFMAIAALTLFAASSCSKEQVVATAEGEETLVSFTIASPVISTKAIADGNTVDKVDVKVYNANGLITDNTISKTVDMSGGKATYTARLVTGQTYQFVFWAYNEDGHHYTLDAAAKKVTVNYEGSANDESRDAFYKYIEAKKITGPIKETIVLNRPFAQLNFGVNQADIAAATAAGIEVKKSAVKVVGVPNVLDLTNGSAAGDVTVSYTLEDCPTEALVVKGTEYGYVSMGYILAGKDEKITAEASLSIANAAGTELCDPKVVPAVPLQGNWRTNILGNLFTSDVEFNIVVDPAFEDENIVDMDELAFREALKNGGKGIVPKDMTLTKYISLTKNTNPEIVIEKGATLTGELTDRTKLISLFNSNINATISGEGRILGPKTQTGSAAAAIELEDNANSLVIDGNLTIEGREGTVEGNVDACVIIRAGKVTVNGGHFIASKDVDGGDNPAILLYSPNSYRSELIINGGVFESACENCKFLINKQDEYRAHETVSICGGTFVGWNPADNEAEGAHTNFVADGYRSVETTYDGKQAWTVEAIPATGTQEDFNDAITSATEGTATVVMAPNTKFELNNGIANEGENSRDITVIGDGTQTFDVITKSVSAEGGQLNYQRGSSFTLKNVTVQAGEGSFDGVVCDEITLENCTIKGKLTLYGKATFVNCVFENTMANQYSIWTWGGTDVKFEGCKFNTNGKAILLYGQATAAKPTNLTVKNCEFSDKLNGLFKKAAVEIGNDYNATYTLNISGCTIVKGFATGKNTDSKLWANKNSMDAEHLSVTIDGVKVL